MENISSLFENKVRENRGRPAVIEDNRTVTFGELDDMAEAIAATFPEKIHSVGIVMAHGVKMIASILAVLKCGARYVPAEPAFPKGRIHGMMEEAHVDFVLTERPFAEKLQGLALRFYEDEVIGKNIAGCHAATPIDPASPAYVLYTSGTTGRPKGVCVTNGNVCHYVRAFEKEFHIGPGDIVLQYSVCSFDIFVEEVFASLLNGAAIAIPSDQEKSTINALMDFVERHGVTIISGFPYLLADMNRLGKIPPSIRLLISGGDVLREKYVDNLLPQAEVYNTYGPSETTVCATYYRCNEGVPLKDGTYPIGRPVLGTGIEILDKQGRRVPNGQIGEICIFGDGVALGYIGDHEEENKAFEKKAGTRRIYHSGDMGYILPDGNIAFLHRKDSQIMIYGKRVEVSEVESRLNRCKGVKQALVRAFKDEDALAYMVAYVVPEGSEMKVSEIRKELSENLTSFMIPEFFVRMKTIPLNVNGKPDIRELPVVLKEGKYNG